MRKVVDVLVGKVSEVSYGGVSIGGAAGKSAEVWKLRLVNKGNEAFKTIKLGTKVRVEIVVTEVEE